MFMPRSYFVLGKLYTLEIIKEVKLFETSALVINNDKYVSQNLEIAFSMECVISLSSR